MKSEKFHKKKAREILIRIFQQNNRNVSLTARTAGVDRKTVYRALEGDLSDRSRRPKTSPRKTQSHLENLIIAEAKETGYRYRRLADRIQKKHGIKISEYTIKAILKRNNVTKKKVRTKNKRQRDLYDYEHIAPFAYLQYDTKHILDANALPANVYHHILAYKLPKYEWNIIDVSTRTRFTAYSHELSTTFGWKFMELVLLWIRAHGIRHHISVQADNGMEFCAGSRKKEKQWNENLKPLNASFVSIPAGKKHLQGIVENSHRHDDEQFLSIHPIRCTNTITFLAKAQQWQDTWNTTRPHFGKQMFGMTPLQKLKQKDNLISSNIFSFPVILLENFFLLPQKNGEYVYANYQWKNMR